MKKLKYLVALLGHIARTATGFYFRPFNKVWDEHLQQILDEGVLESTNKHAVFWLYGDIYEIWISNRWFAYGFLFCLNGQFVAPADAYRPRFRTMYRLHQMVQASKAKEMGNV
ncbi:hypothetical protein EY011_11800 [Shigella flexneri]|uniref:Uncharacterized protein n=1 Tax=Escherichia coli TaxID=562 RepID=A0A376FM83_ECOLX|nr:MULTISPECIES: hypothetical protein [Enterobacteriaceae]EFX2138609.1 hypothetical protein [Shigella flexneri]EFK4081716.1 hypothetical protein [Escherichia coli]EFK6612147.1 hypothetical protein [Escherichia coli]EGF7274097.1 hypothetical protein [Shigella flexneri]MDS1488661.1 hypothetical protein [Escherichia coli]